MGQDLGPSGWEGMESLDRRRPLTPLSRGAVAAVVAATLLITLLAMSSVRTSSEPSLPPASPAVGAAVVRAFAILAVMAEVALFGILIFVRRPGSGGTVRPPRRSVLGLLVWMAQLLAVVVIYQLYRGSRSGGALLSAAGLPARPGVPRGAASLAQGQEWLTASIVLAVLVLAALLVLRRLRAGREAPTLDGVAGGLRLAVDDGLDALEGEADPRRAVIRAYARMESTLARVGVPREPPEASGEYLARFLLLLGAGSVPARRLTDLFQLAKFSRHPVDQAMKDDALRALRAIRADLDSRAAEAGMAASREAPSR